MFAASASKQNAYPEFCHFISVWLGAGLSVNLTVGTTLRVLRKSTSFKANHL